MKTNIIAKYTNMKNVVNRTFMVKKTYFKYLALVLTVLGLGISSQVFATNMVLEATAFYGKDYTPSGAANTNNTWSPYTSGGTYGSCSTTANGVTISGSKMTVNSNHFKVQNGQAFTIQAASGTYLIYNKGTNKFVNVISKYYAKPNETKDNATEIHVGVGEQMTDGSYKVTSLKGNGIEVYDYVEKAVRLAHAFITNYKNSAGTGLNEADLALANQYIDEYKGYAYMRVKPTGAPDEVYALATVPEVPAEVEAKFKE